MEGNGPSLLLAPRHRVPLARSPDAKASLLILDSLQGGSCYHGIWAARVLCSEFFQCHLHALLHHTADSLQIIDCLFEGLLSGDIPCRRRAETSMQWQTPLFLASACIKESLL